MADRTKEDYEMQYYRALGALRNHFPPNNFKNVEGTPGFLQDSNPKGKYGGQGVIRLPAWGSYGHGSPEAMAASAAHEVGHAISGKDVRTNKLPDKKRPGARYSKSATLAEESRATEIADTLDKRLPLTDYQKNDLQQSLKTYDVPVDKYGYKYHNSGGEIPQPQSYNESLLKSREGYSDKVYLDSVGKPTVGTGHLVPGMQVGSVPYSKEQNQENLNNHISKAEQHAISNVGAGTWEGLNRQQQGALTSQAFQLGKKGQSGFKNMLEAIRAGDTEGIHREALNSKWAKQTPKRADDLVAAFHDQGGKVLGPLEKAMAKQAEMTKAQREGPNSIQSARAQAPTREKALSNIKKIGQGVYDLSTVADFTNSYDKFGKGDNVGGTVDAATGLFGLIPGLGLLGAGAFKTGRKAYKAIKEASKKSGVPEKQIKNIWKQTQNLHPNKDMRAVKDLDNHFGNSDGIKTVRDMKLEAAVPSLSKGIPGPMTKIRDVDNTISKGTSGNFPLRYKGYETPGGKKIGATYDLDSGTAKVNNLLSTPDTGNIKDVFKSDKFNQTKFHPQESDFEVVTDTMKKLGFKAPKGKIPQSVLHTKTGYPNVPKPISNIPTAPIVNLPPTMSKFANAFDASGKLKPGIPANLVNLLKQYERKGG